MNILYFDLNIILLPFSAFEQEMAHIHFDTFHGRREKETLSSIRFSVLMCGSVLCGFLYLCVDVYIICDCIFHYIICDCLYDYINCDCNSNSIIEVIIDFLINFIVCD